MPINRSLWAKFRTYLRNFAIAYTLLCIAIYFQQQRLMFFPSETVKLTPDRYQLDYQEVWIPVEDSTASKTSPLKPAEQLHGWWIPAKADNAPVLLYFHHNAVNIGANVSQALQFHEMGYSVLLVDYRGFGQSDGGFPHEAQVYEDAQAAWNYLTEVRQFSPEQIVIYGHSIGGAIAIDLAARQPEAAALVVQSSFTSMREMTKRLGLYWILPIELLLRQRFESEKKMKTVEMPVLIITGTKDFQIPVEMGRRLYGAASGPKQLLIIEDGGHDNHLSEADQQRVSQFLSKSCSTSCYCARTCIRTKNVLPMGS